MLLYLRAFQNQYPVESLNTFRHLHLTAKTGHRAEGHLLALWLCQTPITPGAAHRAKGLMNIECLEISLRKRMILADLPLVKRGGFGSEISKDRQIENISVMYLHFSATIF